MRSSMYVLYFFFLPIHNLTEPSTLDLIMPGAACRVVGQCLPVVYLRGPKSGIGRDGMGGGGVAPARTRDGH